MNRPKSETSPNGARFVNFPFLAEVGLTSVGSPILHVLPRAPANPSHRRRAEVIYELAARMERMSDELNVRWVITVEAWNARIVLELGQDGESEIANQVIAKVIEEFHLAPQMDVKQANPQDHGENQ